MGPCPSKAVDLYWLPLGAGTPVVAGAGRIYEAAVAARDRRPRSDLYHAALQVHLDGRRWVIESAPVWDRPEADRGVVATGPVGMAWLGRWNLFRYEVRRWRDGVIPDLAAAVDSPRRVSADRQTASRLLDCAPRFPAATWGRDEQHAGDMWNSNSLIAWLLTVSGHDVEAVAPPPCGRAPGWSSGVVVARRGIESTVTRAHSKHDDRRVHGRAHNRR